MSADLIGQFGDDAIRLSINGSEYSRRTGWSDGAYWMSDSQNGVLDLPAEYSSLQPYLYAPSPLAAIALANPLVAIKVTGVADFNGVSCHVLMFDGRPEKFMVSQKTSLLEGIVAPAVMTLTIADYTDIDGLRIPRECLFDIALGDMKLTYLFADTKMNVSVDKSRAVKPSAHMSPDSALNSPLAGEMTSAMLIGYFDKNGDMKIDLEEYILSHATDPAGEVLNNFKSIDVSHDNFIDAIEAEVMAKVANAMKKQDAAPSGVTAKQLISMMDKNSDGKIAKDEAVPDVQVAFGDLDTNADGFIDAAEAEVMAEFANEQNVGPPSGAKQSTPKPGALTAKQLMGYMDTDGDHKISKDEASEELKPNFQYLDTNGDGFLDMKETEVVAEYANKQ